MKTYPIITNVRMPKKPRVMPPKKIKKNQTHFTAKKNSQTSKKKKK